MAITIDDFAKIWASTSPLTPYAFSESNYNEGWNFVGATPPSRQMWDSIQKLNDEKLKYLFDNCLPVTEKLPVGVVQAYAGNTTPDGWLLCDGSAISRTDYAELYAVIGDTYGAGDGTTTFNLPDLADKFIQGNATSGTVKAAGLPNITGGFSTRVFSDEANILYGASGSFSMEAGGSATTAQKLSTSQPVQIFSFNASNSNAIYGNSNTVQPPALTMQYIIKY